MTVAAELGVDAEVRATRITDQAAAERARFVGSPTVRIDGRDVDPEGELAAEYSLDCRLYWHEHRLAGYPSSWSAMPCCGPPVRSDGRRPVAVQPAAMPWK
jgi:hypothetical protein